MVTPTVGRMVYYKSYGTPGGEYPSVDRAAVITDVGLQQSVIDGSQCLHVRLCVMNPEGLFFTKWLEQGSKPGQWDWMPFQKDQVARMAPGTVNESHSGGAQLSSLV